MIVKNTHGLIFCWQRIDHTPTLLEYDITLHSSSLPATMPMP